VSSIPASEPAPPPRLLRAALFGLLAGAAAGALEMALRLAGHDEPSVVRRSTELVGYAMSWYAPLGALAFFVLAVLLRLAGWRARPVRVPAGRGRWRGARGAATLCALALAGSWLYAVLRDRSGEIEPPAKARPAPEEAPNVLLVCVDTLRADALGCYGAAAPTPAIDALAARGALFERALAPASWTLPSVASVFTSRLPAEHDCLDFDRTIDAEVPTLADALTAVGYDCRAFLGNPLVEPRHGFERGFRLFDVYGHDLEGRLLLTRAFSKTLRMTRLLSYRGRRPILAWQAAFPFVTTRLTAYTLDEDLNERVFAHGEPGGGGARFLYVQYVSPHTPYLEHPLRFLKTALPLDAAHVEDLRARYAGEVTYVDAQLGELLERLTATGFLERAYVVVTSDHGEEFLEHGRFEHGYGLHHEVLRVPLVIAGPGIASGTRIAEPVQLLDLAPTLLDLVGVERPAAFEGQSLRARLEGQPGEVRLPIFAEISSRFLTPDLEDDHVPRRGLLQTAADDGRWKVLRRRSASGALLGEELFDLERDPGELAPLDAAAPQAVALALLRAALDEYDARERAAEAGELGSDEMEQIKALGYVGNDVEAPPPTESP
jgi:arylsulfatase A-like enzyme